MKHKILVIFLIIFGLQGCIDKSEATFFNDIIIIDVEKSSTELEIFGDGVISTGLNERDLAISPDKSKIYYTLSAYNDVKRAIVEISKANEIWEQPKIASFSGEYNDIEPFITTDGEQFFFCSDRPMTSDSTRTDYNIWVMDKSEDGWGKPWPLDKNINTSGDEFFPSVSKNGNLYFTASKPEGPGREDIYVSKFENSNYLKPIPLDTTINSKAFEFNAFISPNEDILVFSSYGREDDLGGGDLYISVLDSLGNWGKSKNLGTNINSDRLDFCPFIDFENKNFYFTSNRTDKRDVVTNFDNYRDALNKPKNGAGDIYRINLKVLLETY